MKNNQNKLLTVLFSLLIIVIAFSASQTEVKTQSTNLLLPEEVEQYSNTFNRNADEFDFLVEPDKVTLFNNTEETNDESQAQGARQSSNEEKQTVQLRKVELQDKPITSTTIQETQVQETTQVTQASKTEETQVMQTSPTTEAQQVEQKVQQQQVLPDMYGSSVYFLGDSLAYGVEYAYGGNINDSSTVIGATISSIVNNNSGYVYGDIVYVSAGINDIAAGRVVTPEMIDLVMSIIPSSSTVVWMDYYWLYGNQYLVEQSNINLYNAQYRYGNLHVFNWSDYAYNYVSSDGLHANEYMSVLNIIRNNFKF